MIISLPSQLAYLSAQVSKNYQGDTQEIADIIVAELNRAGKQVTAVPVDGSSVTGVVLKEAGNAVTSINMKTTEVAAKELTVSLFLAEGETSYRYFVLINGKYNEMTVTSSGVTIESEQLAQVPSGDENNDVVYTISLTQTGLDGLVKIKMTYKNA